jgi:DNA-binding transcriptional LysR family regulator
VVTERRPHLLEEGFDLVLTTGVLEDAPWVRHLLGESAVLAVASPGWLQRNGTPRHVDDLHTHVLLAPQIDGLSPRAWPRYGAPPLPVSPRFVTNDLSTLQSAARAGMGIALFPVHLLLDDLASGALVPVLPAEVGGPLRIWALFSAERRASPLIRALVDSVSAFAAAQASPSGQSAR